MTKPLAEQRYIDWAGEVVRERGDNGLRAAWAFALASRLLGDDSVAELIVQGLLMQHAWET